MTTLELLLANELPEPKTKDIKVKRLSEAWGQDVVLTVRELSYNEVCSLTKEEDLRAAIVLEGVQEPNLHNLELMKKMKASTPLEMVEKLFQAGEIDDISREIEELSGYRKKTVENFVDEMVEEVKKN